jgi:hypothetical protein
MSKSDELLEFIDLEPAYQDHHPPNWKESKQINAFDTETSDGTVFMLSYAFGSQDGQIIENENVESLSARDMLGILTHRQCRSAINVWYNLNFDINAIFSTILTEEEQNDLMNTNTVEFERDGIEYSVMYVKSKFLSIKDQHRNSYMHYDISQFMYTSLENAAQNWIGKGKEDENIDTSKFGDKQYVLDNYETIREYAIKDAEITRELAYEFITQCEKLDIPMGSPISTGYMSAEYLRANKDTKPGFGSKDYQADFWEAFYGGRFEVIKRGYIGKVAGPDINSAYPAVMANLPDPSTLQWQHYTNKPNENQQFFGDYEQLEFSDLEKADYGVVTATVSTNPEKKIQPFAHKLDGTVNFPILNEVTKTVILPIFEFAVKNNLLANFKLESAWLAKETDKTEYPFEFIENMYAERKVNENLRGKEKKGHLLKIVLNSLFGKTCQTTEKKKKINITNYEDNQYELGDKEKIYPLHFMSKRQREMMGENEYIIINQTAGRRFNPFLAAYITGMTRLELHKQVVNHGLEDNVVMFATDCLMIEKEAYDKSDFDDLVLVPNDDLDEKEYREKAKESLGYWDFDYQGEAFVVGSGVYEIVFDGCKDSSCEGYGTKCSNRKHWTKTKTRGFGKGVLDGKLITQAQISNAKSWIDETEILNSGIELENERPLTMAEALSSTKSASVAEFIEEIKTLNANFDDCRNWKGKGTFEKLLIEKQDSMPRNLNEETAQVLREITETKTVEIESLGTETPETSIKEAWQ